MKSYTRRLENRRCSISSSGYSKRWAGKSLFYKISTSKASFRSWPSSKSHKSAHANYMKSATSLSASTDFSSTMRWSATLPISKPIWDRRSWCRLKAWLMRLASCCAIITVWITAVLCLWGARRWKKSMIWYPLPDNCMSMSKQLNFTQYDPN